MKVLVTGATGYVGGRLVPALLADGHHVRTTVSDPGNSDPPWWADRVETVTTDVLDAGQVRSACEGVEAVYYLVHGMGGDDFTVTDAKAAGNVKDAVDRHRVSRVVYLSGIIPEPEGELSDHLRSRLDVEEILNASSAVVLTLRAAVLMGSGSTSFEIIRQVSERLPVQTVPDWMNSNVQPIAVVDVLAALVGALTAPGPSRHFDVGGPDVMPYAQLLDRYAEIAGLERPQVMVPFLPTDLVGVLVGALTDVPDTTVRALVESLRHDMVCAEDRFVTELLPAGHRLVPFEESVRRALADPQPDADAHPATADPMGPLPQDPHWASGGEDRPLAARVLDSVRSVADAVTGG